MFKILKSSKKRRIEEKEEIEKKHREEKEEIEKKHIEEKEEIEKNHIEEKEEIDKEYTEEKEEIEKKHMEEINNIKELKNNIEKHFKKQNLKSDELLDTIIELQEINEIGKEHDVLIETIVLLHESINLIHQNIGSNQVLDQIELLNIKINEQLIKAKIMEISNENEIFNIKKHEIISVVKTENIFHKNGEIKEVIALGYFYKGQLVKKAKVIVYQLNRG